MLDTNAPVQSARKARKGEGGEEGGKPSLGHGGFAGRCLAQRSSQASIALRAPGSFDVDPERRHRHVPGRDRPHVGLRDRGRRAPSRGSRSRARRRGSRGARRRSCRSSRLCGTTLMPLMARGRDVHREEGAPGQATRQGLAHDAARAPPLPARSPWRGAHEARPPPRGSRRTRPRGRRRGYPKRRG